jgi:hypothetical protein
MIGGCRQIFIERSIFTLKPTGFKSNYTRIESLHPHTECTNNSLNRTILGLKGQSSADISKGVGKLNRTILLTAVLSFY